MFLRNGLASNDAVRFLRKKRMGLAPNGSSSNAKRRGVRQGSGALDREPELATRERKEHRERRAEPQFRMATNSLLLKSLLRTSLCALCTAVFFCGNSISESGFKGVRPSLWVADAGLNCSSRNAAACGKAAVNAPQSRRCARFRDHQQSRPRLECDGFSIAFRP